MSLTISKPPPIENREAAAIQITAAQLLTDARIHEEFDVKPPMQRIMDEDELETYKEIKRREFEDRTRRQRQHIGLWMRYAKWEESISEFRKARSVYERALEVDYTNKSIWLRYAEFEMRHKFVVHARNVWQRAVYFLPREDQFWYKYAYMEQLLSEYQRARDVFQRWVSWQPGPKGWDAFIRFEERLGERERATLLVHRYMQECPSIESYLKAARYEIRNRNRNLARAIYERVLPELGSDSTPEQFYIEFGQFQLRNREFERARQIFTRGVKSLPREKCQHLYNIYLDFQKQHGSRASIGEAIQTERRQHYEKELV